MTEPRAFVRIPESLGSRFDEVASEALASGVRAHKAPIGDRAEMFRFELLCTQLEQLAAQARAAGADSVRDDAPAATPERVCFFGGPASDQKPPTGVPQEVKNWLKNDERIVELRMPLFPGRTSTPVREVPPTPVADTWEAEGVQGKQAVEQRFRSQVKAVMAEQPGAAIRPSGVTNSVLTNGLRDACKRPSQKSSAKQLDARVIYRDGSEAETFPLRALPMKGPARKPTRTLKCSLLSIRHMDMDPIVDGAWLRNTDISRRRPAAQTDARAREVTTSQLAELTDDGPLELQLFQTGLDSAILGFYRAVALHLLNRPGSLRVIPHYFHRRQGGGSGYSQGQPWQ